MKHFTVVALLGFIGLLPAPRASAQSLGVGVCISCPQPSESTLGYVKDDLTSQADGATYDFSLTNTPNYRSETVVLDGLAQRRDVDYTLSANTLSMSTAPSGATTSFYVSYSTGTGASAPGGTVFYSTVPANSIIADSLTPVGVATVTATLNGSGVAWFKCQWSLENTSGGKRTYTYDLRRDGIAFTPAYPDDVTAGEVWRQEISGLVNSTNSPADYALYIQTTNTNVNQVIFPLECTLTEL